MRTAGEFGIFFGPENDLRQTFAVAKINENQPAKIATRMDPAGELDLLTDICCAKRVAVVSAIHGEASL